MDDTTYNLLSKFGDESKTTYSQGAGLRYTDAYWGGNTGPSARRTGFIPNTPISPIQMNTLFSQTTMCSYILGQVLASNIIKDKTGLGGTVDTSDTDGDIVSTKTTDKVEEDYATPLIDFLDRINEISGNGGTGTESIWRSRQIGYGDSGQYWRVLDTNGTLVPSSTGNTLCVNTIRRFNGSDPNSQPVLTFNTSNIASSHQITAPSASITGLTSTGSLSVSTTTTLTGALTTNGTVTLGNATSDTVTINGNTDVESTITIKGGRTINIGETSGGTASSNRATAYLWARYNSSDTGSTYTRQSLETILYNIGTRLDNLGFSSGGISSAIAFGNGWSATQNENASNMYYKQGQTSILDGVLALDMSVPPYNDDRRGGQTKTWSFGTLNSLLRPVYTLVTQCPIQYSYIQASSPPDSEVVFATLTIESSGYAKIQFSVPQNRTISANSKVYVYFYQFGYRLNAE